MLMYEMTKCVGYWKQFRSNSGNGCSTSQGVLYLATGGTEGYTRGVQGPKYCGVHHQQGVQGPGTEGYTTGQRGIRSAPSLPARFLNTSTLQLETLQHTLKKNHQSHIWQKYFSIFHKTRIMLSLQPTEMSIREQQHRCSCLALNKTVRRGRRNSQDSRKSWPSQQRTNTEVEFNQGVWELGRRKTVQAVHQVTVLP